MKRLIRVLGALAFVLLLAASVKAQDGRVTGQVLDTNGKPWPDVTVTLKSDTGRVFTVKTDKDGKYSQIGLPGGMYTITVTNAAVNLNFKEQRPVQPDDSNVFDFNFKELAAQQQSSPQAAAEEQKRQEAQNLFKQMQQHFNAGRAALDDSDTTQKLHRTHCQF